MHQPCWQFNRCPPERRCRCTAYPDHGYDCWNLAGTWCDGVYQASRQAKLSICQNCSFYQSENCQKENEHPFDYGQIFELSRLMDEESES
ncbi:MAG: hypothetical protein ACETWC_09925 [Acidobacteriota bacterium]